jgi:protein-S-isoprenylcysteine O-methyltransferase Ste14
VVNRHAVLEEVAMEEKRGEHPFGDNGQAILLVLFFVVWIADSFFLHWTTSLAGSIPLIIRLAFLGLALITALVLIQAGGVVLRTPERPNYVVHTGAFHYVRHPLYLASMLVYLGLAVSTFSLVSLALMIPVFLFHNYIAGYEEKLLEAKLGEAYRDYERRTGKWLPGIGRKSLRDRVA